MRRAWHEQEPPPEPIFVDRTGHRRRLFTIIGAGVGVVLLGSLIALVASVLGGGSGLVPGLPGVGGRIERAGAASTSPTAARGTAPGLSGQELVAGAGVSVSPGPMGLPGTSPAPSAGTGGTPSSSPTGRVQASRSDHAHATPTRTR